MPIQESQKFIKGCIDLLRWNKPSGRLILLIPACWSLWLTPSGKPSIELIGLICAGGFFVSGAGCIANDLWDRNFDRQVERTKYRPLALGVIKISTALFLLLIMLTLSLLVVFALPVESRVICLKLAFLAIPPIILYPSTKRWFKYPQIFLAICWGFSVLIPWAASEANLQGGLPLVFCWAATCLWTFGFDTVYAMSDIKDDKKIGLNSSAIALKGKGPKIVAVSYILTSICFAIASFIAGVNWFFWPVWLTASIGMQREVKVLKAQQIKKTIYINHFKNQVLIGSLLLIGLIIGRVA